MRWDAVVVGGGPNGLAAAVTLASEGLSTLLVEANDQVGGAARTEALTLPGFRHDVGSAVYPMGRASPFFSSLPLEEHGLSWIHPPIPVAHPLGGDRAAVLRRSVDETAEGLGVGADAYRNLVDPFVEAWPSFVEHVLDTPLRIPRAPLLMARFAARAFRSATGLAGDLPGDEARALVAGSAAHSGVPLETFPATAVGLVLTLAGHAVGWPVPRGGAGALADALAGVFQARGGTIEVGRRVTSLDDLPAARCIVLALTPRQVARVAADYLPKAYARKLEAWRYGPGAFKVDWALDGPIPWTAPACREAGTVHVGGTLEEVADAERAPAEGRVHPKPFVLLAQPSLFDETRAPEGRHTAWAYCHVPNGWSGDHTTAVEAQVERFAPGFRDRILARRVHRPADLETWDANLVGGDVNGGELTPMQWLGPRRWTLRPWSAPAPDLYVCSAATPPGGGVHGMCGHHAARSALHETFGLRHLAVFSGAR